MNLSHSRVIPVFIQMQTDTGEIYRDQLEVIAEGSEKK